MSIREWLKVNWQNVEQGSNAADWIRDLESSDSRLHKERVIKKALVASNIGDGNAQTFLLCAYAAYNPFLTFNVKKVPETSGLTKQKNPWSKFWLLMSDLSSRKITGHDARDAIETLSQEFDSSEWNFLARRTLIKDLRCGISEKTLNKILKKSPFEIPLFECQLAKDSEDHASKMRGRSRLEVKLDGVRNLAVVQGNSVVMHSRNGKVFDNFGHIEEEILAALPAIRSKLGGIENFVLDGEVIGNTFQELMRQARRKKNAKADDSVYYVFDIIPLSSFKEGHYNAQQHKRIAMLEKIMPALKAGGKVQIMPGMEVDLDSADGRAVMQNFARASVDKGYEGIMIKSLDAPYQCKRSTFWMKWKPVHDYDLTVVDVEEGTGKNAGRMGALVCEGVDQGKKIRVNVGSGFSDEQRNDYWKNRKVLIGQTIVVISDDITKNQNGDYSLRFPRFKTFRDDK
jgi:DNA ligase-1